MAIDTGSSALYDENFPISGIDQPSQGFRDNFMVIRHAIEALQRAESTPSSVLGLSFEQSGSGMMSFDLVYRNNALIIPTGEPTSAATIGMIRTTGKHFQHHDGEGWRTALMMNADGGVSIEGTSYFEFPAGPSADRPPVARNGMIRFNADTDSIEYFSASIWTSNFPTTASMVSGLADFINSTPPSSHIHADATVSSAGFMSSGDKTKLDGIAPGATANDTDANLKNRANHTGEQAISTVSGLQAALDGKEPKLGFIPVNISLLGAPNGVALLDESGFIEPNQLPPVDGANHTHANATTTAAGFMSAADKTKLNGIATGATANDTDTNLKNRANHTGAQAINTVTGLQAALDGKAPSTHSHSASDITDFASAVDARGVSTATANRLCSRDASGNVSANLFVGLATSARYADVAERYAADQEYQPGTVVVFGGEYEITASSSENDTSVAGIISTDPAFLMNSDAGNDDTHPYVALVGRVPCKVFGPVRKGQLLTTGPNGAAVATSSPVLGSIVGKALEDHSGDSYGVIEVSVQRS